MYMCLSTCIFVILKTLTNNSRGHDAVGFSSTGLAVHYFKDLYNQDT